MVMKNYNKDSIKKIKYRTCAQDVLREELLVPRVAQNPNMPVVPGLERGPPLSCGGEHV